MKLISWNVNGIRACLGKGFLDFFNEIDADVFCIQETKMQEGQAIIDTPLHHQYFNSAVKKGYSGVAVFTKTKPLNVTKNFGIDDHSQEGRTLTLEFENFFLVNVYTPNSQDKLGRLSYRLQWEYDFREYLISLKSKKPVVLCGDLNVAHNEIDLKNPKTNHKNPGFSDEERGEMTKLIESGFTDTFRFLYKDLQDAYSWWSYRFKCREKNIGWRIDYFVTSSDLNDKINDAKIHANILGSDHCPVELEINL
ncbi:MAG: exodeoxyribonuclease III [Oscillospiraceae bacterium]